VILGVAEGHAPARQTACFDEVLILGNHGASPQRAQSTAAMKAYFLKHLLLNCTHDAVIYLDPDTRVYSPFKEVIELLKQHDLIAAPYLTEPMDDEGYQKEIDRLKNGFLHTGFLALRNTDTSRRFADWWSWRTDISYYGPSADIRADQKWLSLGMTPFQIYLLKDPGYHIAAWNLHERSRAVEGSLHSGCKVAGKRLRSFSFANPEGLLDRRLQEVFPGQEHPVRELYRSYGEELDRARQS
jgi:hypothetical protein